MQKIKQNTKVRMGVIIGGCFCLVIFSNLYLQWCQNDLSVSLALKFAFSWHVEKFFLACLVLGLVLAFFISFAGSLVIGASFYSVAIGLLGFADYQKMTYRQEPIYPDDLKMVTHFKMLIDMVGPVIFGLAMFFMVGALISLGYSMFKSRKLSRKQQLVRGGVLLFSILGLNYVSHFNNPNNLLRKAYNRTALWIPYSQKMNYYNTGFIGGFLYNLRVEAMEKPSDYSKENITEITQSYQQKASAANQTRTDEQPNIIYVMSESFSDPNNLAEVTVKNDPLKDYYEVADETYSGRMLSQNFGGGTANIEFEALTSFSMELLNAQLTTPYTMLLPKLEAVPSIVSVLNSRGYQTSAIHPYNTSMYKRKDVYQKLGFETFLDQDTMTYTDKIEDNPYISDESAYQQVLDVLDTEMPQFVHLVTMQTHMPYSDKYETLNYPVSVASNQSSLENYAQDVAYSSEALQAFLAELKDLERRSIVVFWGDHLPGIYSDAVQEANDDATLHETQFLMYDTKGELTRQTEHDVITSPFYFAPNLLEQTQQPTTGFYELLLDLETALPAFEKNMYYQEGKWHKEVQLTKEQQLVYEDYQMIQYDILAGQQYSLNTNFFG